MLGPSVMAAQCLGVGHWNAAKGELRLGLLGEMVKTLCAEYTLLPFDVVLVAAIMRYSKSGVMAEMARDCGERLLQKELH